ncbi:MAG: hypothetical protein M1838_002158 [Thelocarpon superellum]|nr:MAG: hypothetical protein M1838_002158 [Thelocarpon superellum]
MHILPRSFLIAALLLPLIGARPAFEPTTGPSADLRIRNEAATSANLPQLAPAARSPIDRRQNHQGIRTLVPHTRFFLTLFAATIAEVAEGFREYIRQEILEVLKQIGQSGTHTPVTMGTIKFDLSDHYQVWVDVKNTAMGQLTFDTLERIFREMLHLVSTKHLINMNSVVTYSSSDLQQDVVLATIKHMAVPNNNP